MAGAQNTLSYYSSIDKSKYTQVDFLRKLSSDKYSTSYLARRGNDVIYVVESTHKITYAYATYGIASSLSGDDTWYESDVKDAYEKSYDATTGKWTLIVTLGDYREIEPSLDHHVFSARVLLQYDDQPKDHVLIFVSEK